MTLSLHLILPLMLASPPPFIQVEANAAAAEDPAPPSQSAEALRARIHGMRMNLLLGGNRVRDAEAEAVGFYNDKVELVETRIDTIQVELSEKNASYNVLLERALSDESSATGRRDALAEATRLRSEVGTLESEKEQLETRRGELGKLITSVESRDRERSRLATQLETNDRSDDPFGIPFMRIGLAPAAQPSAPISPLEDEALVRDLLERDPAGAKTMLFEMDPVGYWQRFPLQPPRAALRRVLAFPPPDLPGRR